MKKLINLTPNRPTKVFLCLLPFALLVLIYMVNSNARLDINPNDKLLPSFSKMGDGLHRMALEPSKRSGDYVFWKDTAEEIILPTLTGRMGVLTNHISALTGLDNGAMLIRMPSSDWISVASMGGFALIKDNKVTILVNEAELASEINFETAESEFLAAKANLESVTDDKLRHLSL